jgi:hypothetical protein
LEHKGLNSEPKSADIDQARAEERVKPYTGLDPAQALAAAGSNPRWISRPGLGSQMCQRLTSLMAMGNDHHLPLWG